MRKKLRIGSVIIIAALYCFAISGASSNSAYLTPTNSFLTVSDSQSEVSEITYHSYYHTIEAGVSIIFAGNLPTSTSKTPFQNLLFFSRISEQLILSSYSQYSGFFHKSSLRSRKTDLIFPFHYFW